MKKLYTIDTNVQKWKPCIHIDECSNFLCGGGVGFLGRVSAGCEVVGWGCGAAGFAVRGFSGIGGGWGWGGFVAAGCFDTICPGWGWGWFGAGSGRGRNVAGGVSTGTGCPVEFLLLSGTKTQVRQENVVAFVFCKATDRTNVVIIRLNDGTLAILLFNIFIYYQSALFINGSIFAIFNWKIEEKAYFVEPKMSGVIINDWIVVLVGDDVM